MIDDDLDLRSVNWSQGMFLTPDHFLRQEKYVDSLMLWLLRYTTPVHGLVGGGPRVDSSERGAPRFDPVVEIDDSGDLVKITVSQCRGVTSGGLIVDVHSSRPLQASFSKRELDGATDVGVFVVARPHDKEADDGLTDPVNPDLLVGRRMHYAIRLDIRADEVPGSLIVTRLRRADNGLRFERTLNFIPPCAYMTGHSALMAAFRQLNERVASIADRYSALHLAIVDFLNVARARQLNVEQDVETLAFVSRMVAALEACAFELLEPIQSPRRYFQELMRLVRNAALFLSLSPPTREYFRQLSAFGDNEFEAMLQQETDALKMGRSVAVHEDLNVEVQATVRALERLDRLEQALEGKYMDYRVSPSLESINFVFDRTAGTPVLYRSVAKPTRPMAHGQELTFVFAPLRLEARESFRLILIGDRNARFEHGDRLNVELRINPGEGYERKPEYVATVHEVDEQRNFAVDFNAPSDVSQLNDLRVSLRSSQPIRSAMLYVRSRLTSNPAPLPPPPPLVPRSTDVPPPPRRSRADAHPVPPSSPPQRADAGAPEDPLPSPPRRSRLS